MITILEGCALKTLRSLAAERFRCCCTSPPYYGLRDYGHQDQIGLEKAPAEYVGKLVEIFREVRRVLKDDGTLWLNLGDSYATAGTRQGNARGGVRKNHGDPHRINYRGLSDGLKTKDLIGIPWLVAFALQADGWFLRSAIPWIKRNPMPESVDDRPTSALEYVFLLAKSERYFFDAAAIAMPQSENERTRRLREQEQGLRTVYDLKRDDSSNGQVQPGKNGVAKSVEARQRLAQKGTRNRRNSDWFFESWQGLYSEDDEPLAFLVNPKPFRDAHFAVWPEKLVEPMIRAGSQIGDEILDPFGGSGTTGKVALELGRKATLCELNPAYLAIARQRCETTVGLPLA